IEPPVLGASVAPGKLCVGSLAATASVPCAAPGELVMYGAGPLLPEADTTMTPSLAVFAAATESGAFADPNGAPSDMLIASMWLSTAHSIASMSTASVTEPLQPKTRTA